ncbi:hypothetical protein ABLE91_16915 [Aquabacter sp. CN5-332]|uniref:hypothetical protein n=1 Tax=Aquabacter sp. CN5-332 TaxID=3156608 RepID=UPI0032B4712F
MKQINIEALLRWTYRDELPKVGRPTSMVAAIRPGWSAMSKLSVLHTVVQETDIANRWGLVPLDMAADDPHPDALAVAEAVERLGKREVELPGDWSPLSDMGDLGDEGAEAVRRGVERLFILDAKGLRKPRQPLSRLVIRHAILGSAPAWEGEVPARRMICEHGKPKWFRRVVQETPGPFDPVSTEVEIDGYNHTRQRPYPGAYRKFELVPDPMGTVVDRGERELWVAALAMLAEDLQGRGLIAHTVTGCIQSARPWEAAAPEVRILPSTIVRAVTVREGQKKKPIPA